MFLELKLLFVFFFSCGILGFILFFVSYWGVQTAWDYEKVSIYECGFIPFEDSRGKFPIQFLMFAIIFLIFDLELSFFFPWSLIYLNLEWWGIVIMVWFVFFLLGGYFFEYMHGIFELD